MAEPIPGKLTLPRRHQERLAAAQEIAGWHLGDREWADALIGAYFDPESALDLLEEAKRNA